MKKGQISIDLLFTLVAVLLILITVNGFIEFTYKTHDKLNTQLQLDLENERVTNFITQTQMIDETKYTINTSFNKITFLDENKTQHIIYPDASIEENYLKLTINTGNEILESTKPFFKAQNTSIGFGTGIEKGTIVIQHE